MASIRVCRDAVTRRSLGYAYVNYNSALDASAAERAMETLNYQPLAGRPMRIMMSQRDPASRKSGVGNIFIKNLDKSIDNKALYDTFSAFGNILSCKVAMDAAGESKGYGFVHYEKDESAALAADKVNGMLLEGKKVYVGPFLRRQERPNESEARYTNIFVKNLDESVSEEEMQEMFGAHGKITSAVLMMDEEGKSRGFGFINFEEPESAASAVEALNNKEINGKELYCGRAQKKSEREAMLRQKFEEMRAERIAKYQGMNLYVKNLADDIDDDLLREEFSKWGTITSAKVMTDSATGKSKGFGFVCYSSPEEATRAVTELSGKMIHNKPIYVALAQRRDVRKAQLEQQYAQRFAMGAGGPRGGPMGPGMFPPGGPGAGGPPMFYGGGGRGGGPMGPMNPYMMAAAGGRGGMGPGGGRGGPRGQPMMMGPGGMMMGPGGGMMMGPGGGRGGRGGPPGGRGGVPGRGGPRPEMMMMMGPGGRGPAGGRGGPGGRGPIPGRGGPLAPRDESAANTGGQLTAAMLASAPPETQKQLLGERLFPMIANLQPDLAGKITGMLLEMDNSELLLLLESPESLDAKVEEAVAVLKQHNAIPEGAKIN